MVFFLIDVEVVVVVPKLDFYPFVFVVLLVLMVAICCLLRLGIVVFK